MLELLLSDLPLNTCAVITSVSCGITKDQRKLLGLGIVPGSKVIVHRHEPHFLVSVGNTLLGLDRELACCVVVKVTD